MPARIRLQRRGVRNHPYWWIVISDNHTNPHGRIIEKMGFWIPTAGTNERSIILNRPRLKYWLGVGAEPTRAVIKLMSMADFFPKAPPVHGTSTLYSKPAKEQLEDLPLRAKQLGAYKEHYHAVLAQEERNRQFRKIMQEVEDEHGDDPSLSYEKLLMKARARASGEQRMVDYKELLNLIATEGEDSHNAQDAIKKAIDSVITPEDKSMSLVTIEQLMAELNIDEEDAEEIIETFEEYGNGFTQSDLDDFKLDLTASESIDM